MFIQEKYLITQNSNGAAEGSQTTKLKCKFCGREFMVPTSEVGSLTATDVCEASNCQTAYDKERMYVEMEKQKENSPEAEAVRKAIGS